MVIPYVDMLRAVIRRTRAGLSPLSADRKHLHHTMLEIGHSHRSSVLILYAWAALFAGAVVGLSIATVHLAVLVWTTLAAVLALALLSIPKWRWWERSRPDLMPASPASDAGRRSARASSAGPGGAPPRAVGNGWHGAGWQEVPNGDADQAGPAAGEPAGRTPDQGAPASEPIGRTSGKAIP